MVARSLISSSLPRWMKAITLSAGARPFLQQPEQTQSANAGVDLRLLLAHHMHRQVAGKEFQARLGQAIYWELAQKR